jgi:hypothetical protein
MAIIDSGALTFTAIQNEFGGSHPISLSEYYRNGSAVPSNNTNVSESGLIRSGMFYSAVNEIGVTVSSGASTYNVQTAFSSYWNVAVPKRLIINSGVTLGHLTVPASMAGTLIIDHSGAVQGLGGTGNGGAGSTAMTIQSTGVTINMASGSTISAGGGAGGNGGTGGQGSASANSCSCGGGPSPCNPGGFYGGGCCQENDNGCMNFILCCYNNNYYSGGAGGASGVGQGYNQSQANGTGGSAGGTNAGAGGSGGNGATFGNAGANGATGANGNHTNGSAGSAGGAAGRAITFSGVSAYTIIGTASGTIHGAYT